MTLCNILQSFQLPRKDCRRADITRLARFNYVVQSFHRLFHWSIRVQAMNLVNVDVIKLQTFQAVVDFRHNVFAGRAAAVGTTGTHFKIYLRRNDNLVTVKAKVFDITAGNFFARAHLIDIRRVEIVNAEFNRTLENFLAVFISFRPRKYSVLFAGLAEAHHTQTNARNIHARIAEFYILHLEHFFQVIFAYCTF